MSDVDSIAAIIDTSLGVIRDGVVARLPDFIGAALLIVVGWFLARLLRVLVRRTATFVDALLNRFVGAKAAPRLRGGRVAVTLGAVAFWTVWLVFVTAATHVLGLTVFTDWLMHLLEYLPTLAVGVLIIIAGYVLASFVSDLVLATAMRLQATQRAALARLAKAATLTAAMLIGADQIGIDVSWLAMLIAVLIGGLLGGVAIAVSLGSRAYVANLIGAHYLRQMLRVGQRVRIVGVEGRILELTATSLVIETQDGRVLIPGRVYNDETVAVLEERHDR